MVGTRQSERVLSHAAEAGAKVVLVGDIKQLQQPRDDLIDRWDHDRQASPDRSRIILTHTNDEVRALNEATRMRMRAAGDLGNEVHMTIERGARNFASGDRVMFLRNERGQEVRGAHARLHRAERRLDGLATLAHGLGVVVEAPLRLFQHMLIPTAPCQL